MSSLFFNPNPQFGNSAGDASLAGALLYTYEAGTTTNQATYSDSDLTTPNANPIVADAAGRFGAVYLSPLNYRFVLRDSEGNQIWDIDNYAAQDPSTNVSNYAALKALSTTVASVFSAVIVSGRATPGDQGGGVFAWRTGDQSANITADPQEGLWVPPSSDISGASGAWQRLADRPYNLRWFGATGDGSDEATAIQAWLDQTGHLYAPDPPTAYRSGTELILKSNTRITGDSMYSTVFGPHWSMALTDRFMVNENDPSNQTRQDENIVIEDVCFDGDQRSYIPYIPVSVTDPATQKTRNSTFNTRGTIVQLRGVSRPRISNVQLRNQESFGFSDLGCLDAVFENIWAHNNGKVDDIGSPIYVQSLGSLRKVTSVTLGNPTTIVLDGNAFFSTNDTVYVKGLDGVESIPDGDYTATNVSGDTFEIAIDTSGDSGYVERGRAYVGSNGFVGSENTTVRNCLIEDNLRSGITFMPTEGGRLHGCRFYNNGESTIFSNRGNEVHIWDCTVDGTTLTDIIAAGLEFNNVGGGSVRNLRIANTATDPFAIIGGYDIQCSDIYIEDCVDNTGSLTYPYGPLAEDWNGSTQGAGDFAGTAVNKTSGIRIVSADEFRARNISIKNSVITDRRATTGAIDCLSIEKTGASNRVDYITIDGGDWSASGVAKDDMVAMTQSNVIDASSLTIRGIVGHHSQHARVQLSEVTTTGLLAFDLGFVPAEVEIEVYQFNDTNRRESRTVFVRNQGDTSGTLGIGVSFAMDGIESSSTSDINADTQIISNDAYRVNNGAGTAVAQAEFQAWTADSTAIGMTLNVTNATNNVRVVLMARP